MQHAGKRRILCILYLVSTSLINLFLSPLLCLRSGRLYYFWFSFTSELSSCLIAGWRRRCYAAVKGLWEAKHLGRISAIFHLAFSGSCHLRFLGHSRILWENCASYWFFLLQVVILQVSVLYWLFPLHFTLQHATDLTHTLLHPLFLVGLHSLLTFEMGLRRSKNKHVKWILHV